MRGLDLRADREEYLDALLVTGTAFILAVAQWRHIVHFFDQYLLQNLQAEVGVLQGYPHWRFFQSRVLAPFLEHLIELTGVNLTSAHAVVAVFGLTGAGLALFYAAQAAAGQGAASQRVDGRQKAWTALLAMHVLFMALMSKPWLYIWDFVLLLTTAVFYLLVLTRAPWWAFLALLGVACFNHESAVFIGGYMMAKAVIDAWVEKRRPDWRWLASGLLGSVAAFAIIEFLRKMLLKEEVGYKIFRDIQKSSSTTFDAYFHIQVGENFGQFYDWITDPSLSLDLLIPVYLATVLGLTAVMVKRHGVRALSLAAFVLVQVLAVLALGLTNETRTLLHLIPFVALAGIWLKKPTAAAPGPFAP
ncbi:hypothetical protein FBZ87_10348 [Nitrospirillum amazonense]|uniref:Uncharacterized protein n=1 Tax=Nitrospirillum amazonense TaxID=28077 RepID=A0A560K5Y3_9PROT|nr:hypothetical protein [Nitrospirillum amazonense]TWB77234.1 hypothetical protein FBZ87_10348 [Nitrospirillum amazonense]